MASNSRIEWCEATWNPVVGCTRASAGCDHCYAFTMTRRLAAMGQADYAGLTTDKHFNGVVRCLPHKLDVPLKRKKPTMYFVNSMSDLFHKDVPFEFIDQVFAVMALRPQHTFQVLTKRPERMEEYFDDELRPDAIRLAAEAMGNVVRGMNYGAWPLPNVWLGTSCENQQQADLRIPHLLKTPAAVRFVSAEPMLGPISLNQLTIPYGEEWDHGHTVWNALTGFRSHKCGGWTDTPPKKLDWVIVGGESGHHSRPCDIAWIRSITEQCQAAGVAVFVKQLGKKPISPGGSTGWPPHVKSLPNNAGELIGLRDKKGGDWEEWPTDLRVREYPQRATP